MLPTDALGSEAGVSTALACMHIVNPTPLHWFLVEVEQLVILFIDLYRYDPVEPLTYPQVDIHPYWYWIEGIAAAWPPPGSILVQSGLDYV